MKIAVRLRWEPGIKPASILTCLEVICHYLLYKIQALFFGCLSLGLLCHSYGIYSFFQFKTTTKLTFIS